MPEPQGPLKRPNDNEGLLARLTGAGVEYVIVGGLAAILHGSTLPTEDLDICASMGEENLLKLVKAFTGIRPKFRTNPLLPPLPTDRERLRGFKNLYLVTDLGKIDVLGDITGVGDYDAVSRHVELLPVGGAPVKVLDLNTLIVAKRAAGRPKDRLGVMHLEAVRRDRQDHPEPL